LSLRNIDLTFRSKPFNLATLLVALLPVSPKYQFKDHWKTMAVKEQQIHNREVLNRFLSLFFLHSTCFATEESVWFVRMVWCGNVIALCVHGRLTTLKTFTCTESGSLIALCAKHINRGLEKGIYRGGNWKTIGWTSKRWCSRLSEMGSKYGKHDNIWNNKRLEPLKASSGIWNASLPRQSSYPIFFIPSILVSLSIWWTGVCPSLNNIPGSTHLTSSGWWCLHNLASLISTCYIARKHNGVVRRWKHSGV
jgi:hypothetical protein